MSMLFWKRKKTEEEAPDPKCVVEGEVSTNVGAVSNVDTRSKQQESDDESSTLKRGLEVSRRSFLDKLKHGLVGHTRIDDEVLDELENTLIASDVGVDTTLKIIERIQARVKRDSFLGVGELNRLLVDEICSMLPDDKPQNEEFAVSSPYVIMVVGVNGVGKTTTIAKLAALYSSEGKKVFLGAADTFRAAAVDQISAWGDRLGVTVIKNRQNADPASVTYDTLMSARSNKADVVLIDTAGRLHNKVNLMNELEKIKRVMQRVIPDAPHDIMLVLDGSTGQNAFIQAKQFTQVTPITSLCVTKLDGTAKGGVVIGISDQLKVPVRYIGIGEQPKDLLRFDKTAFVRSILGKEG